MEPPTTRRFTAARIVALALIALALAGLAYLRFASGSSEVSVPQGAHAGQLTLHPCTYATENGELRRRLRHAGRAREPARLALAADRAAGHADPARSRPVPREPVFRLQGGPGLTNMDFPDASRFAGDRDVVLVGYRGVDGSSVLDCPEAVSAMKHARDLLGRPTTTRTRNGLSACAARLRGDGVDLAGYSLPERVDDLEAARRALGYRRIDLLSESAGTRTALIYGWRYPPSIHRSVMVGVNPPGQLPLVPAPERRAARTSTPRSARATTSCSSRTNDLAATIRRDVADDPGPAGASCGSSPATRRSAPSSACSTRPTPASPISAPHDDRHLARRLATATRAGSGCSRRCPSSSSPTCR